jgi:hypothetical protein
MTPIKYVCVATEMKLYLPYLKQLIPELVILGMHTPWEGFITKYKLLQAYLSSPEMSDDTLICFIDAYDLLPTKQLPRFESNYRAFIKANPAVKIIVGYDRVENIFHEYISQAIFGTVDDERLNSGQFIGSAKNVREMITYILTNTAHFQTDQIELTKYANQFKTDVYIDVPQAFFYVRTRPLQQVLLGPSASASGAAAASLSASLAAAASGAGPAFIHANGNGLLDQFLQSEHGIQLDLSERWLILKDNVKGVVKKILMYDLIYMKKYLAIVYKKNGLFHKLLDFIRICCGYDILL